MLRSRAAYVFGQSRMLLRGAGKTVPSRSTATCILFHGGVRNQSSSLFYPRYKVGNHTAIANILKA